MAAVMLLSVGRLWKRQAWSGDAATSAANQKSKSADLHETCRRTWL